jgi:hypothetical protein
VGFQSLCRTEGKRRRRRGGISTLRVSNPLKKFLQKNKIPKKKNRILEIHSQKIKHFFSLEKIRLGANCAEELDWDCRGKKAFIFSPDNPSRALQHILLRV